MASCTCSARRTRRSTNLVANRQVLETSDERRRDELWVSVELNGFQARQQFGEEAVHLHPGQRCAQTEVHPVAECQVLVRIASDVETERFVEQLFITVSGDVREVHR